MSENTLLFELLCEELPPSSQKQMSDFLATEITKINLQHRIQN